jgi:hypothetical protein
LVRWDSNIWGSVFSDFIVGHLRISIDHRILELNDSTYCSVAELNNLL